MWPGDLCVVFEEARVRKLFCFATEAKAHQNLRFDSLIVPLKHHAVVCHSLTSSPPSISLQLSITAANEFGSVKSASIRMADQNIATRPRRSAAIEAQMKVEESYEIWGQPPSEDNSKRPTSGRKRSITAEASAARKRRRTSIQERDGFRLPAVLPKTEAENEISTQPAKRGREQPRKIPVHQSTLAEIQQPTKKITLSVPNPPAFKEAPRRIRDAGGDARPPAESHTSSHAVSFDDILDGTVADFSAQGTIFDTIAKAQSGSVPPNILISKLAERRPSYNVRSDSTFQNVEGEAPGTLHNGTQIHQSSPRAGVNAASPSEEQTKFDPIDWELGGTPSKSESPR